MVLLKNNTKNTRLKNELQSGFFPRTGLLQAGQGHKRPEKCALFIYSVSLNQIWVLYWRGQSNRTGRKGGTNFILYILALGGSQVERVMSSRLDSSCSLDTKSGPEQPPCIS